MFKGQTYTKPHIQSAIGAFIVALLAFLGSHVSPFMGYLLALSTLIMLIVALYTDSIWPTQAKAENKVIFSIFWGLIFGIIAPHLISAYLEGGFSAIYDIFSSQGKRDRSIFYV